jgi:hypothetical protein
MITMKPPALADALVNAFSVSPATANEILGDLAEEWPERLDRYGAQRARTWYWGQTLRAIPHLFHQWWRETTFASMVAGLSAAVLMRLLLAVAFTAVSGPLYRNPNSLGALFVGLLVGRIVTDMVFGGLVAQLVRRAPLVYLTIAWVFALITELALRSPNWGAGRFPVIGITETVLVSVLVWLPVTLAGALLVIRSPERERAIA